MDLPFNIQVSDYCPADTVFIVDPAVIEPLFSSPIEEVMRALQKPTLVCADEKQAERIREAAKHVGRIDL